MGRYIVFLMYHELELPGRPLCQSEPGYVRYILSRESFREQIQWLRQDGWSGLSVSQALTFPVEKSVAITFDDGSETDLIAAAPILKESGFNATFYVTAGFLGKSGYLSPEQLRALLSLGFEIGCHSMTHAYLNDLARPDLQREISDAGKTIEDIIGRKVEHFSCPGGRYDARALAVAKDAGYFSVATSRAHANSPATDPFLLGRVAILRTMNNAEFHRVCTGEALRKMRWTESARDAAKKLLGNTLYDRFRARLLREE
ncbi:MAG: polysaccharide deacetylase family protein [Candidatus Sulfotelmatobacter sp.]|jgi:peptidoglycan/xylan/chitin deacetylase (PgdA/CDA1 family)